MSQPQEWVPVDISALQGACFRVATKSACRWSEPAPAYYTADETLEQTHFRPTPSGVPGRQFLSDLVKTSLFVFEVEFKQTGQNAMPDNWPEAAGRRPVDQQKIVVNAYRGGACPARWHFSFTIADGLPDHWDSFFEFPLPLPPHSLPGAPASSASNSWWDSLTSLPDSRSPGNQAKVSAVRSTSIIKPPVERFLWAPSVLTDFSEHPSAMRLPELERMLGGLVALDGVHSIISKDFPGRLTVYLEELALAAVEEERTRPQASSLKGTSPLISELDGREQAANLLKLPAKELIQVLRQCSGRRARALAYWKLCEEVSGEGLKFTALVKEIRSSPQTMESSMDAVGGPQVPVDCPRCLAKGVFRPRRVHASWLLSPIRFANITWHFHCHSCGHNEGTGRWGYSDEGVIDCGCRSCVAEREEVERSALPPIIEGLKQVQLGSALAVDFELAKYYEKDINQLLHGSAAHVRAADRGHSSPSNSKGGYTVEMRSGSETERACPWQPANEFGCTVESMANSMRGIGAQLVAADSKRPPSLHSMDSSTCLSLLDKEGGEEIQLKDWVKAFEADRLFRKSQVSPRKEMRLRAQPAFSLAFEIEPAACQHLPLPDDIAVDWTPTKLRGFDRLEAVFREAQRPRIAKQKALQAASSVVLEKRRLWLDALIKQQPPAPVLALIETLQAGHRPSHQELRGARDSLLAGELSGGDSGAAVNALYWNFGVTLLGSMERPLLPKTAMGMLGVDEYQPPYQGIEVPVTCPCCDSTNGQFTFWGEDWSFDCAACGHHEGQGAKSGVRHIACLCEGCVSHAQAQLHGQDLAGMLAEMLEAIENKSLRLSRDCSLSRTEVERSFKDHGIYTRDLAKAVDMSWKRVRFNEKWVSLAYALNCRRDLSVELATLMHCDKPVMTKEALAAVAMVCDAARLYGEGRSLYIRPLVVIELRRTP